MPGAIGGFQSGDDVGTSSGTTVIVVGGTGMLFLPPLLMIVFRQKYPRWWFDWNLELLRFTNRVGIYFALMDDRYPSTDEQQSVHLDVNYPDAQQGLNRWLPLVKWFLAIPTTRSRHPLHRRLLRGNRAHGSPSCSPVHARPLRPGHRRVPALPPGAQSLAVAPASWVRRGRPSPREALH